MAHENWTHSGLGQKSDFLRIAFFGKLLIIEGKNKTGIIIRFLENSGYQGVRFSGVLLYPFYLYPDYYYAQIIEQIPLK